MLTINKLSPVIGAEISGANLISPSDEEFKELEQALSEHSVLFFRDQPKLSRGGALGYNRPSLARLLELAWQGL